MASLHSLRLLLLIVSSWLPESGAAIARDFSEPEADLACKPDLFVIRNKNISILYQYRASTNSSFHFPFSQEVLSRIFLSRSLHYIFK